MPRVAIDYSKTVIYRISHKEIEGMDYVGSTVNFLCRKGQHKSKCVNPNSKLYNIKLYQTIRDNGGWDCFQMLEIKKYPCTDHREAEAEEENCRKELKATLNMIRAFRSDEEKKEYDKRYKEQYYKDNKEEISERDKQYYEQNKDRITEQNKEYYHQNKDRIADYHKQYRELNKDKITEHKKQYAEENKTKISDYKKQYQEKNKEQLNEISKLYYEQNKEKRKENMKTYREEHRDNLNKKAKEKFVCECCNSLIRTGNKAQHERTQKHQANLVLAVGI